MKWLVVAGLVIAAGVAIWVEVLEIRVVAKRFGEVVPGRVYRSGQLSRYLIESTLRKYGIEVIIDLTCPNPADIDQQKELEVAAALGVEHHRFPLGGDGTGDVRNYAGAVKLMAECEQQGRPVLVHCSAGAQRTGGILAAYRMLVRRESPGVVYRDMVSYGWRPHRDLELLPYLNENLDEIAALLVDQGVIDGLPGPVPRLGTQERRAMLAN